MNDIWDYYMNNNVLVIHTSQNLSKFVKVCCTSISPYFFHFYFYQISVFDFLYGYLAGNNFCNGAECYGLFLHINYN